MVFICKMCLKFLFIHFKIKHQEIFKDGELLQCTVGKKQYKKGLTYLILQASFRTSVQNKIRLSVKGFQDSKHLYKSLFSVNLKKAVNHILSIVNK